jgi:hypothetical protein
MKMDRIIFLATHTNNGRDLMLRPSVISRVLLRVRLWERLQQIPEEIRQHFVFCRLWVGLVWT